MSEGTGSEKNEQIMWGLLSYGPHTYLVIMYRDEYPLFRFGAFVFDSDGEIMRHQVARWWYDPENKEYYDKCNLVVEARRIVFAMMLDIIARDIIGLFDIRDRVIKRSELKEMFYSDEGDDVYGFFSFHDYLRKKHFANSGLNTSYSNKPV